jgi:Domain of unknown function (DUF3806)
MDQTITDPTKAELDWVVAQRHAASRFVASASPNDAGQPLTLAALDRAFKAWISADPEDVDEINGVINAVGVAFGQFLVEGAGLRWVIATDEHGSDLAVFGLPSAGDVLVYPANFVAKRWERRETGFLAAACKGISADTRAIAAKRRK